MYYLNARYYDPDIGMFLRPDPAMDGLNHYAYGICNPVMYSDPTGMELTWKQWTGVGLIIGGAILAVVAVVLVATGYGAIAGVITEFCAAGLIQSGVGLLTQTSDNITIQAAVPLGEKGSDPTGDNYLGIGYNYDYSNYNSGGSSGGSNNSINASVNQAGTGTENERAIADFIYHNQTGDIDAPTNKYCVYNTAWDAYKAMYLLIYGIDLAEEYAQEARRNAVGNGVKEDGYVYDYYELAKSFQTTFRTNFKYFYWDTYESSVPDFLAPNFYNNGVDLPHVRFDHEGYAHTSISLGNQKIFDVWHNRVEMLGKPVTPDTRGWDDRFGNGLYRYGYHMWRL